ncbi:MAG: 4-alpha-glucanotransferase [Chitinophagales bacterium]|nr:4-alpha-glucanotransferase [Chitinophagales bacterium]
MKIQFYLRFHTSFGQTLWISDNGISPETDLDSEAIAMTYLNDEFWTATLEIAEPGSGTYHYKYILKREDGEIIPEWGTDRVIDIPKKGIGEIVLVDTWNHAGEYENCFFTAPFTEVLLKKQGKKSGSGQDKVFSHVFRVKAPLVQKDEVVCLVGSGEKLRDWDTENPILMGRDGHWQVARLDLNAETFPIAYKYGVYNTKEEKFVRYETGDNRILHTTAGTERLTYIHDGFIHLPNDTWKGAGVAIPVFSLRSKKSFGVGEFTDIQLLVDWARQVGMKLVQILPVNDTTATHTWEDSYPYAAISAFALHPLFINLETVAGKKQEEKIKLLRKKQKQLNEFDGVDYETVMKFKLGILKELYEEDGDRIFKDEDYKEFYSANAHWLVPYAAFCFLRDKYGTAHFDEWETHSTYDPEEIRKLDQAGSAARETIRLQYFIQYHLHCQLKEATAYAHKHGIIVKGDIPIGIYRYGCDAWMAPELYEMNNQAGAPPDDFAIKGQNWGFPTYNWKKMQEGHFDWWRKRFEQMSNYFDAFRIDHILGFFRIWAIPEHAREGIMGHFVPAIPVSIQEFGERGIWFDQQRYTKPFITDDVLGELAGDLFEEVKSNYLSGNGWGSYALRPEFDTQKKVEAHFAGLEQTESNRRIKFVLFDLISNVLLFEDPDRPENYHFRIAMDRTISFRYLEAGTQQKLKDLYVNYFFERQDEFWKTEAMHKLPYLKRATNMLICGEDLGMVPSCVPDVMKQLGILSLEIQRMPKDSKTDFFNPASAPYLSVVTPSTHDMSTIRGWWEEDKTRIQRFFNQELGQGGDAPYYCEAWINRAIVLQHLYSPAMWSIFQLQDILGMNELIRRENPHEERINIPANPKHYWRYRMHLTLEDLIKEKDFNRELADYIHHSGRNNA